MPMSSKEQNTCLLYTALQRGDVSAAQQAIEDGADTDANFAGETPLHWAVEKGLQSLVRVLLKHGCNPSPRSRSYLQTPLHLAAYRGDASIAKMLIEGGAELEAQTNGGWTPLHVAVDQNAIDLVGLLLEKGADINAKNRSGENVLHFVQNTNPDLYRYLLDNIKDKDPRDEHGATPILYAAAYGRKDIVEPLDGLWRFNKFG